MLITAILLQEDALAEATAAGEEDETIPELGLDKKKKKKKKREVNKGFPAAPQLYLTVML